MTTIRVALMRYGANLRRAGKLMLDRGYIADFRKGSRNGLRTTSIPSCCSNWTHGRAVSRGTTHRGEKGSLRIRIGMRYTGVQSPATVRFKKGIGGFNVLSDIRLLKRTGITCGRITRRVAAKGIGSTSILKLRGNPPHEGSTGEKC